MSGVGASIGIDRLLAALEELRLLKWRASTSARALIVCMDKAYMHYAHYLAESFRRSKILSKSILKLPNLKSLLVMRMLRVMSL